MDWQLAIARNRNILRRIVAALYALAGVSVGQTAATLPRHVYWAILRVLRPAESAVRRLIFIVAHGLIVAASPARAAPVGLVKRVGAASVSAFCLIDPLKRFAPFSLDTVDFFDEYTQASQEEDVGFAGPSFPRISVPGFSDSVFWPLPSTHSPDDLVNARHLTLRLAALHRALGNLPAQARRLARWRARLALSRQQNAPVKPRRLSPLRPGLPPGYRVRRLHEVDGLLRECHGLAIDLRDRSDTS